MSHNTGPCLAWCHDNRSKLRRLRSTLEYRVRLQDFVELVRQERRMDAVRLVCCVSVELVRVELVRVDILRLVCCVRLVTIVLCLMC